VVLDLSVEEPVRLRLSLRGVLLYAPALAHMDRFSRIQDRFMRDKGIDYFENTRRATHVQQLYAIENPLKFNGYGPSCWGITASDGPGPDTIKVDGVERQFFNYIARGVPFGLMMEP